MDSTPRLVRIRLYPLKGAAGFDVEGTEVGPLGIPGDRRWMLVRPDGAFLSQRTHPKLCLIRVRPQEDAEHGTLRFMADAPSMEPLELTPFPDGEWMEVRVHEDRFKAPAGSQEADRWFSSFLGVSCRLVFFPQEVVRPVDPGFAQGHTVGFADGYPIHLTSRESLDDLNGRLSRNTNMSRYRPNLVVAGGAPWEEDEWRVLRIGEAVFRLVKPCARCTVTTVHQGTGIRGREPLRTLRGFRALGGKVYFGQNLVVEESGRFRVGSDVHIVEKGVRRPMLPRGGEGP